MNYLIAAQTDIGPVKKTNQDSYCIQTARSKRYGNLLFAVVCDGMGGLKKGEVASATVVARFTDWFAQSLPILLSQRTMDFCIIAQGMDSFVESAQCRYWQLWTGSQYFSRYDCGGCTLHWQ